jgi:hypothetical protein
MPKRSFHPRRPDPRWFRSAPVAFAALLLAPVARAEFARPPESPYRFEDPDRPQPPPPAPAPAPDGPEERVAPWEPPPDSSTFRFHVGPAVLLEPTSPGLFAALDVGQRAVGARVSASWLRPETEQGISAYSGELWIDFRHGHQLHPVLGAGASFLRGGALGDHESAGAGLLRGALEYELPIADADARLSLSVLALVPAIGSERTRPWTMAALTVGAGF